MSRRQLALRTGATLTFGRSIGQFTIHPPKGNVTQIVERNKLIAKILGLDGICDSAEGCTRTALSFWLDKEFCIKHRQECMKYMATHRYLSDEQVHKLRAAGLEGNIPGEIRFKRKLR